MNNYVPDGVWMIRAEFIADASPQIITIPENLEASFNNDGIHLTWDEITDEGFSHFILDKSYNEQFNPGDFTSIIISETNYHDTDYSQDSVTIYYRLSSEYTSGIVSDYSDIVSIVVNLGIDSSLNPEFFCLHQNHPNPFNPTTKISYDLLEETNVKILIFDTMGRYVNTLVDDNHRAGHHSAFWNGTNKSGHSVSAGVYVYVIQTEGFYEMKKMILLK